MTQPAATKGLPAPAFRLTWRDGTYRVSKPNVGDTDCFTADQMHAYALATLAASATQPTAAVQGGLTDEQIDELARKHLNSFTTKSDVRALVRAALSANAGSQQGEPVDEYGRLKAQYDRLKAKEYNRHCTCDECGKSKADGWALYCVTCLAAQHFALPPASGTLTDLLHTLIKAHDDGDSDIWLGHLYAKVQSLATPKEAGSQPGKADYEFSKHGIQPTAALATTAGHAAAPQGELAVGAEAQRMLHFYLLAQAAKAHTHQSAECFREWAAAVRALPAQPAAPAVQPEALTDEQILHCNYPDHASDAIIAAPDSELIAFGRAVLAALSTPGMDRMREGEGG